jgi:hypothetical protein
MRLNTQKSFTKLSNYNCLYIYKCSYLYILIQDYKSWSKFKLWAFIKKQTFNLENPLEKQLAKINSFYEVLNKVENELWEILYSASYYDKSKWVSDFTLDWWEDQWSFQILYDYEAEHDYKLWKDCFIVSYSEYQYWKHIQWLEDWDEDNVYWCYSKNEFNLLMQIYFWVYQEELKNKLEEKDKNWEYEEIKDILKEWNWKKKYKEYSEFEKDYLSKPEVQEYLKLELIKKDTSWAFEWLEIEKIYDKDWSEEKQRKYIDEINKEFGGEVVVEE